MAASPTLLPVKHVDKIENRVIHIGLVVANSRLMVFPKTLKSERPLPEIQTNFGYQFIFKSIRTGLL